MIIYGSHGLMRYYSTKKPNRRFTAIRFLDALPALALTKTMMNECVSWRRRRDVDVTFAHTKTNNDDDDDDGVRYASIDEVRGDA